MILVFLLTSQLAFGQENSYAIDNWKFRKANTNDNWFPAKVPGTVHTDLFSNGLIPDPFAGCNHKELGWVDESDWEYTSYFNLNKRIDLKKPVDLIFDGIDTYSEVILNGTTILITDNMFREWVVECSKYLKETNNQLTVRFTSALKFIGKQKAKLPFIIPGEEHAYTRKSPYHFGWDWAPRFVTCGIWKPVYLAQRPEVFIQSSWFTTKAIDKNKAEVEFVVEISSIIDKIVKINLIDKESNKSIFKEKLQLKKGVNQYSKTFQVARPKLWWPNNLGEQHMYNYEIRIANGWSNNLIKQQKFGIRTVEVVNEPDSIGTSFYFKVNGKPFFAKGANIVPPHSFLPSVTDSTWIALAEQARISNINMLRVWGGGAYPPDVFLNACSEKGILIWQDFMFACSMTRWDNDYLESIKEEATQQVKRIRQFPCLAMWCGNNEIDEAWHNWGWDKQNKNVPGASDSVWNGYKKIFHQLLPGIVKKYDPDIFYWPSSPQNGWGRKESMTHGDSHYWGVWWGKEPFDKYKEKIPRFMSEYGYQGSPVMETVKRFSLNGESVPDFIEMKCHQKHPTGYETIETYMKREGFYPKTLEEWVYLSQITQLQGYKTALEAQRLAMPRCMGSLYWQLNDCWPVVSWSGIDYLGRWKAVQYAIKDLYYPVIISTEIDKNHIIVKALSEYENNVEGNLIVTLYKTDGSIIEGWSKKVSLTMNTPKEIFNEGYEVFLPDTSRYFLHATLFNSKELQVDAFSFYSKTGNVKLENPKIKFERKENTLILSCEKPAFYVQIADKNGYVKADRNYFNMLPGHEYRVNIFAGNSNEIEIKSLWNYLY